jgi:hypothetical protein
MILTKGINMLRLIFSGFVPGVIVSLAGTNIVDDPLKFLALIVPLAVSIETAILLSKD